MLFCKLINYNKLTNLSKLNFEHLLKVFIENYSLLPDKTHAWKIIREEYDILRIKKEKLKLGKVIFEIKNAYYADVLIYQDLEMIHCRQDNTAINERKVENIMIRYEWKWDFNNISAALIILYFVYSFLKTQLYMSLNSFNINSLESIISVYLLDNVAFQELIRYIFVMLTSGDRFINFMPFRITNFLIYQILGEAIIFFKFL